MVSDPIRLLEGQVYVFAVQQHCQNSLQGYPPAWDGPGIEQKSLASAVRAITWFDRVTTKPSMNVSPWPRGVPDRGVFWAHTLDQIAQVTIRLR